MSAPVGVEGLLSEAVEVGTLCNIAAEATLDAGLVATADALSKGALIITRLAQALAQQPEAVDEAMVERAWVAFCEDPGTARQGIRAALTAALAAQPQGGA